MSRITKDFIEGLEHSVWAINQYMDRAGKEYITRHEFKVFSDTYIEECEKELLGNINFETCVCGSNNIQTASDGGVKQFSAWCTECGLTMSSGNPDTSEEVKRRWNRSMRGGK